MPFSDGSRFTWRSIPLFQVTASSNSTFLASIFASTSRSLSVNCTHPFNLSAAKHVPVILVTSDASLALDFLACDSTTTSTSNSTTLALERPTRFSRSSSRSVTASSLPHGALQCACCVLSRSAVNSLSESCASLFSTSFVMGAPSSTGISLSPPAEWTSDRDQLLLSLFPNQLSGMILSLLSLKLLCSSDHPDPDMLCSPLSRSYACHHRSAST